MECIVGWRSPGTALVRAEESKGSSNRNIRFLQDSEDASAEHIDRPMENGCS